MTESVDHFYAAPACRHDVSDLVALAREALPSFPALHDPEGWRTSYRFGSGLHPRDNYLIAVRDGGEDGPLVGFIWVDAAMAIDYGVIEPWWCINAVAVAPAYRRAGHGRALVLTAVERARAIGVALIYGLSVRASVPFWEDLGFTVAADREPLVSDRPARRATGELARLDLDPETDHRWFVAYLQDPASADSVLVPKGYLARG